jgi:hypothetical protein
LKEFDKLTNYMGAAISAESALGHRDGADAEAGDSILSG